MFMVPSIDHNDRFLLGSHIPMTMLVIIQVTGSG